MYAQQSFRFQKIRGTLKINILFKFANNFILLQRTNAKEKKKKEEEKMLGPQNGQSAFGVRQTKKVEFLFIFSFRKKSYKTPRAGSKMVFC